MANKNIDALDNVLSDVPAAQQTAPNGENKYVTNAFQKALDTLTQARESGTAVWQTGKEELDMIHYPEVFRRDKEGQDSFYHPASANVLIALQEQKNRNTHDFRWMKASEALAAKDISVRQGAKAVDFVFYTKVQPEDKEKGVKPKAYTAKMFNLSDLYGEGVPAQIVVHDHTRDMYARDMVFYMSRREANNTLSFENAKDYMRMVGGAIGFGKDAQDKRADWVKAQAEARAEQKAAKVAENKASVEKKAEAKVESPERKAMKEESAKRLDVILAFDSKKAKTPADNFIGFMKEGYEQNPRTFVTYAVEKAMKELKFTQAQAKTAIGKFAPGAAFDSPAKQPYADRVMANMAKQAEKNRGNAR